MTVLHKPSPSLTYLGRPTPAPTTPDEAVLDRVPNPHSDMAYAVRFTPPADLTTLAAIRQNVCECFRCQSRIW